MKTAICAALLAVPVLTAAPAAAAAPALHLARAEAASALAVVAPALGLPLLPDSCQRRAPNRLRCTYTTGQVVVVVEQRSGYLIWQPTAPALDLS